MELTHTFTVPATIEETWAAFNDIESVAGCFPGARVTSVEGDSFEGECKVKLGPIALVYKGAGTFTEKDESTGVMRIEAKGKDKRGNGTAGANVIATLTAAGGATEVSVQTDLAITGKPAQFGRGVMQDVSDKLLGQFTACLEKKVGAPPEESAPDADAGPSSAPTGAAAVPAPEGDPEAGPSSAPRPAAATDAPAPAAPPPADDALDLGATVLPVVARMYWKQALGAVLALLVVRRLLRRG